MYFVAADLSLSSAGFVALPAGWGGDWSLLERLTLQTEKEPGVNEQLDLAERMRTIAWDFGQWLHWLVDDPEGLKPTNVRVFYERPPSYAFNAQKLVALAAVVQDHLLGGTPIPLEPVDQSSVRKLLLGALPEAKLRKPMTLSAVRGLSGFDWDSDDELDAFANLNFALSTIPGEFFFAAPPVAPKPRARRGAHPPAP